MAHITTPPIDLSAGGGPVIRRPSEAERRSALAVLLTGRADPSQAAVDHFLAFTSEHQMPLDGLWAAYDGPTPVHSSLIIPGAGRTAVLFISPVPNERAIQQAGRLYRVVIDQQSPEAVRLIQVLLEPAQARERQALRQAGFTQLASLIYMRRSCYGEMKGVGAGPRNGGDTADGPITVAGKPLTRYPWGEAHADRFAEAIDASYEKTLDCPGLVGVRDIEDIIAGHRAVGRFEPTLWSAYFEGEAPAAVLLLNPLVDRRELELVYLGLTPAYRGMGLATTLMRRAFASAKALHYTGIHLAVDQDNAPAMGLYQSLGFRATGRKTAMIYVLK